MKLEEEEAKVKEVYDIDMLSEDDEIIIKIMFLTKIRRREMVCVATNHQNKDKIVLCDDDDGDDDDDDDDGS